MDQSYKATTTTLPGMPPLIPRHEKDMKYALYRLAKSTEAIVEATDKILIETSFIVRDENARDEDPAPEEKLGERCDVAKQILKDVLILDRAAARISKRADSLEL